MYDAFFRTTRGVPNKDRLFLETAFLVVTGTSAFIFRTAGVEVVSQREAYCLCIGIDILSRMADSIVSGHVVFSRTEDVVGKKRRVQSSLQECFL